MSCSSNRKRLLGSWIRTFVSSTNSLAGSWRRVAGPNFPAGLADLRATRVSGVGRVLRSTMGLLGTWRRLWRKGHDHPSLAPLRTQALVRNRSRHVPIVVRIRRHPCAPARDLLPADWGYCPARVEHVVAQLVVPQRKERGAETVEGGSVAGNHAASDRQRAGTDGLVADGKIAIGDGGADNRHMPGRAGGWEIVDAVGGGKSAPRDQGVRNVDARRHGARAAVDLDPFLCVSQNLRIGHVHGRTKPGDDSE